MRTNKSLANEYGISQKNMTKNPSGGMGLNPNLNIEDEYIENLLKQVHFLNMETKLIKEKQKENKGMGIMGLLNKDQNPVVTHAITSNEKFSQMKNNLGGKVNNAETQYLKLDDENFAVKAQRDYAQKLSLKEEQRNIEHKIYVQKELSQGIEKLKDLQKRLQQLRQENGTVTDQYDRVKYEWEQLTGKDRTKNLIKEIVNNLDGEAQTLKVKHLTQNTETLTHNEKKLKEADQLYHADENYKQLVQESGELKDKLKKSEKELFELNYKAKEMEELKKLSIRNRDVEIELKKQAVEETQRVKKKLGDKKGEFEIKLKEEKSAIEANDDVRLIKGKNTRKDKEISDIKKKTEVSETNYKRLRDEVLRLEVELTDSKAKNKQKQAKIHELTTIMNETGAVRNQCELDHEKGDADLNSAENSLRDARGRLESLEEELAYLQAKEEFLIRQVNIDEGLKQVKIEQLTSLMHSNTGLNDTIGNLMQKWDQIIKFSREPPV